MISKESIEFAKMIYDKHLSGKTIAAKNHSILDLLSTEVSATLAGADELKENESVVDYLTRIQAKGDVELDTPQENILSDYGSNIATRIKTGIMFTKQIVVPELKELYSGLMDVYKKVSKKPTVAFNVVPMESFSQLGDSDFTATLEGLSSFKLEVDDLNKLDSFLTAIRGVEDKGDIVAAYSKGRKDLGYSDKVLSAEEIMTHLTMSYGTIEFCNADVILCVMKGIKLDPYVNTGSSSVINSELAEMLSKHTIACNHKEFTKIHNDLCMNKLIHSEYDTRLVYNAEEPTIVYVYKRTLDKLGSKLPQDKFNEVIGGSLITDDQKYNYRTLSLNALTPECIESLCKSYQDFMINTISWADLTVRDRLYYPLSQALKGHGSYVVCEGDNDGYPIHVLKEHFAKYEADDIDDALYTLAKELIQHKYRDSHVVLDVVGAIDSEDKDINDILFAVYTNLVTNFTMEQLSIYHEN